VSEDYDKQSRWRGDANRLLDTHEYNEWMNKVDYVLPLPGVGLLLDHFKHMQ
jgi:hypothetical protein